MKSSICSGTASIPLTRVTVPMTWEVSISSTMFYHAHLAHSTSTIGIWWWPKMPIFCFLDNSIVIREYHESVLTLLFGSLLTPMMILPSAGHRWSQHLPYKHGAGCIGIYGSAGGIDITRTSPASIVWWTLTSKQRERSANEPVVISNNSIGIQ